VVAVRTMGPGIVRRGECFVFDKRVAVSAGLRPSTRYVSCHGCRGPMDRRLLLSRRRSSSSSSSSSSPANGDVAEDAHSGFDDEINSDGGGVDVDPAGGDDGNKAEDGDEAEEEKERHLEMARGIPDLPPLRYDAHTRRHYLPGLTCPRCHASTTRISLERFAERERQLELCRREGRAHFQDLRRRPADDFVREQGAWTPLRRMLCAAKISLAFGSNRQLAGGNIFSDGIEFHPRMATPICIGMAIVLLRRPVFGATQVNPYMNMATSNGWQVLISFFMGVSGS